MLGSETLDVAIGIVFVYLVMSLVASAAVELIEAVLQNRARQLERGLAELLQDPGLVESVYKHPLISSLYPGTYSPPPKKNRGFLWLKAITRRWNLPSYIPSENIALALMDLVLAVDGAAPRNETLRTNPIDPPARPQVTVPTELPKPGTADNTPPAVSAIAALVKAAAKDAEKTRQNIEEWFNTSMDRVSGWYKRRTHFILFVIAIGAAALLNVDSVAITQFLVANKTVRAAIVNEAEQYVKNTTGDPAKKPSSQKEALDQLKATVNNLQSTIATAGVPIGWPARELPEQPTLYAWSRKILGLLITGCAVSLGAPFWFDMLNKIIVVRSTVKPKEKSGTEGAKEPQAA